MCWPERSILHSIRELLRYLWCCGRFSDQLSLIQGACRHQCDLVKVLSERLLSTNKGDPCRIRQLALRPAASRFYFTAKQNNRLGCLYNSHHGLPSCCHWICFNYKNSEPAANPLCDFHQNWFLFIVRVVICGVCQYYIQRCGPWRMTKWMRRAPRLARTVRQYAIRTRFQQTVLNRSRNIHTLRSPTERRFSQISRQFAGHNTSAMDRCRNDCQNATESLDRKRQPCNLAWRKKHQIASTGALNGQIPVIASITQVSGLISRSYRLNIPLTRTQHVNLKPFNIVPYYRIT